MKKTLFLLLILCPLSALAQYPVWSEPIQDNLGNAIVGATVAVCGPAQPTLVVPCGGSSLVPIYTSFTGGAQINPIFTDQNGRAPIYAAPGNYFLQIYGAGLVTTVVPISIGSGGGGVAPPGVFSIICSGCSFGSLPLGSPSAPAIISLQNNSPGTISGITIFPIAGNNATDFVQTGTTCGATLAPTAGCNINIVFTPSTAGPESANIKIADSDPLSPWIINFTGSGFAAGALSVSPATSLASPWNYGTINVGQNTTLKVTLYAGTNTSPPTPSPVPITITSIVGPTDPDFLLQTTTCPTVLLSNNTCLLVLAFQPLAVGTFSATVTITDSAASSPQIIYLTGTAVSAGTHTLQTIVAQPPNASVSVGGTTQLTCLETFADASTATPPNCPWYSSNISDATVSNPGGAVMGVASGTVTVTPNSGIFVQGTSGSFSSGTGGAGTPVATSNVGAAHMGCNNGTGAPCTSSGSTSPTISGNTLLLICQGTGASACSVSDLAGNTWIDTGAGFAHNMQVFYAKNIIGITAETFTCTLTGASTTFCQGLEFTGASTTSPIDGTPTFTTGTGTTATGNVTTTIANDKVVGAIYSLNALTCSGGSDAVYTSAAGSTQEKGCEKAVGAAGAQTVTATLTSAAWVAWAGALSAGSSVPTTTLTTAAMGSPVAAGDTLVCSVGWGDATATLSTFTDTAGDTFTLVGSGTQAHGLSQYIYYSVGVATAASETFTATWASTGALNPSVICGEWNGLLAYDTSGQSSNAGSTAPTTAITAGQASDFIADFTTVAGATTVTAVNTGAKSRISTSLGDTMAEYPIYASGSVSPAPAATLAASNPWIFGAVAFTSATQTGAPVVVSGTAPGPYTIQNREPANQNEYAGSPYTIPLPSDAESHCWNNGVQGGTTCTSTSPDKLIINCIFSGLTTNCTASTTGSEANAAFTRFPYRPGDASGGGIGAAGVYYAQCTDPVMKIISQSSKSPEPPANNPVGKYFHIPILAQWGNSTGGDNYLNVWDQCTDGNIPGNSTPGGRRFSTFGSLSGNVVPKCICLTTGCADSSTNCQLALEYGDFGYPSADTTVTGEGGAFTSLATVGQAMIVRGDEWIAGTINHAILVNVNCVNPVVNYPAQPSSNFIEPCTAIGLNNTNRLQTGMLLKIANSFDCTGGGTWLSVVTAICRSGQQYGFYLSDTNANATNQGVFLSHVEGGVAYNYANLPYPLLEPGTPNSLAAACNGTTIQCSGTVVNSTETYVSASIFRLMPGLVTGNNLLIVDQCIPKRMGHQPGAC